MNLQDAAQLTPLKKSLGVAGGLSCKEGHKSTWYAGAAPHNVIPGLARALDVGQHHVQPLLGQLVELSCRLQQDPATHQAVALPR